jgi:cysteine synthase
MVRLQRVPKAGTGQVLVKLEDRNFGGSVKSRVAKHLIQDAERRRLLVPGGTIIESSSGNLGVALTAYGIPLGYKVVVFVDPKTTPTNLRLLKAYGAQVEMVDRPDGGSYQAARNIRANELHHQTPNSYRPDQLFNRRNARTHFRTTAPEIMRQCGARLDYVVVATGSGGQVGGISRWFGLYAPHVKVVAVDPIGSAIFGTEQRPYDMTGTGLAWTPDNIMRPELIDSVYKVADGDAFLTCRVLARQEGLLLGGSGGACALVAVKIAGILGRNGRVVAVAPDSGERYLATVYDDEWLAQHGHDTATSLEEFGRRIENLVPFSLQPAECTNYHPEMARVLGSPLARQRRNRRDTPINLLTPAGRFDGHTVNGKPV